MPGLTWHTACEGYVSPGGKASNVFALNIAMGAVDEAIRSPDKTHLQETIATQQAKGKSHFIVVANITSTLFGSMNNTTVYAAALEADIAVWMILMTYGRYGWEEKTTPLLNRASWLARALDKAGIACYRNPCSNIVTIRSGFHNREIATRYGLVPDNHQALRWYKIVVMVHVTIDRLIPLHCSRTCRHTGRKLVCQSKLGSAIPCYTCKEGSRPYIYCEPEKAP